MFDKLVGEFGIANRGTSTFRRESTLQPNGASILGRTTTGLSLAMEHTMYVESNPRTKKELKERVAAGRKCYVFSPGPFPAPTDGECSVEGPHYPKPHTWYARVVLQNGIIVKVR